MGKLKLAVYWASSCGGCDISIVELGEHLLELAEVADIVFWPCGMDFKYEDVEGYDDGYIDVCLFDGAIRTEDDLRIARLLRKKSKLLVAYGSCAMEGCIPGLGNIKGPDYALNKVALEGASNDNPEGNIQTRRFQMPEGELELAGLLKQLHPLDHVVHVDYKVPGCPPNHEQTWKVMQAIIASDLPANGSTVGVDPLTVCDQCPRTREGKIRLEKFLRPHEIETDPERCLMEQGLICAGPATHAGCGAICVNANMPCRGCYGPPEGVVDQGAALLDAVVAGFEGKTDAEIRQVLDTIVDPVGTFYRFSLGASFLSKLQSEASVEVCDTQADQVGEEA